MSDDPFDDPIIEAAAFGVSHSNEGTDTLQAFLMTFVGIPLAIWGGYYYLVSQWQDREIENSIREKKEKMLKLLAEREKRKSQTAENVNAVITEGDKCEEEEEEEKEEVEREKPTPLHPEIVYMQSVKLLEKKPLADQGPRDAFIIENTPAGLIAMGYDFEKKRWIYWANNTPHFRVLDTVARVYANTHNRQELYVSPAVADAANAEAEKEEGELEKIAQDSKASLFIEPTPVGAADKPKPDKMHVANCFKRQGMLSELRFIPEGPREAPKKTSYTNFLAKQNQVV